MLALGASFLLQNGVSIQSGTISQKSEARDCAINAANVAGNLTVVNCPGIPAKALEGLNRELTKTRLSADQARRQAEEWRQKYDGLQALLSSAGLSQLLIQKASSYLAQGDLTQASAALDEALKQNDQEVATAAAAHYFRAKLAELEFDAKTYGEQLGVAHRLVPNAVIISNEYGIFLTVHGHPLEAESIFKELIDDATQAKVVDMQAASLINASGALKFQGRLSEAKEDLLEAAPLWEVSFRQHKPNALNNEAVAFSGAAEIALLQQHSEEAKELIGKAVALAKSNLTQEGSVPSSQQDRLNLADFLLTASEIYTDVGDLDAAFSLSEEAYENAKQITAPDLANRGKGLTGNAKTSESLITARRMNRTLALKYSDDAVAILDPMKDTEGDRFKGDLANALFVRGAVQEDMGQWSNALASFERSEALNNELQKAGQSQYKIQQAKASWYAIGAALNSGDRGAAEEYARKAASLVDGLPPDFVGLHTQILAECAGALNILGDHAEAAEVIRKRDRLVLAPKQ